ncbi:sensor histidine kinase [Streptomyces sp. RS10V-4]|uniref:sensor histidine kinase n=1 Tax=Streptomyces rhizoryzae TaxID=2932493 RepID=UPI002002A325|nr:sensor histidine kinase [Streptomyces rhizoryzae]MCK7621631.1 sensor histidine kinase [Streptomyces rhizoryzae]
MDGRQRPGAAAPTDGPPRDGTGGDGRAAQIGAQEREGGWSHRLPWTQTDALVAIGASTLDLLAYLLRGQMPGAGGITVAGIVLVVLSGLPLLARRSRPLPALAAALVLQVAIDLSAPAGIRFGAVLAVAVYSVGHRRTIAVTAAAGAATAVAVAATALSQDPFHAPSWKVLAAVPFSAALIGGTGLAVARWQREVAANRQLMADRAVAAERRRIARELHDIVAHHITTMQLMSGGARANLGKPEVVQDALVTLESSGRLALREMRQLLNVLRAGDEGDAAPSSPQPGAEDLDRLVDESCLAGLPTEFTVDGPRRPLPPTVGLTVFRIVQESLTNARKYAGPARAFVRLVYHPDRVTVEVRDDGPGAPPPERLPGAAGRAGYGLIGMRERVALHGGTLATGPRPSGGFTVLAELPLHSDESADAAVQHGEATR